MNPYEDEKTRDSIKEKPHYSYQQVYRLMGCAPNAGVDT